MTAAFCYKGPKATRADKGEVAQKAPAGLPPKVGNANDWVYDRSVYRTLALPLRHKAAAMQQAPETMAFKQLNSIERLVNSAGGTRTPCLYYELKHMAINKDSDWRPVVCILSESAVLDRIKWCEAFIGDILILRKSAEGLQQRAARKADLKAPVGSRQHIERKLMLLLARGEDIVTQSDICEDILLRALRRMLVLAEWAHTVSP